MRSRRTGVWFPPPALILMSRWPKTHAELERTLIAAELRCARCSYNLRGLSPLGVCPECGQDIWTTLVRTVDPAASRLPKLTNPRAVAWSILWIMLCASAAALLLAYAAVRDALNHTMSGLLAISSEQLALGACAAAVLALPGVVVIAPPRRKERSRTIWLRIWLLAIGLLAWALANYAWSMMVHQPHTPMAEMLVRLGMCGSWALALIGIDGILKVIGQRSRAYRTARGGRQSAQAMIAASAAVALGTLIQGLVRMRIAPTELGMYGKVLVWASSLMLLIGLAYMLINTLWIWRSLLAPPPSLDALLLKVEDHGAARRASEPQTSNGRTSKSS